MLKGLIFDLDGVITDSAKYHWIAWSALAKKLGITLPPQAKDELKGLSRMDSLNLILQYGKQVDRYSESEKIEFAKEKNEMYLESIKKMTPNDLLPGIAQLLTSAKEQKLKMAIASASLNAPRILKQLQIINEFDAIVDPATLHKGKPDPEIYVRAQELLKLKSNEVISFEDAAAGVAAIKAAHQFAVGIGNQQTLKAADYVVPSTADLSLDTIEAIFRKDRK